MKEDPKETPTMMLLDPASGSSPPCLRRLGDTSDLYQMPPLRLRPEVRVWYGAADTSSHMLAMYSEGPGISHLGYSD
jgi:hypothetical protein